MRKRLLYKLQEVNGRVTRFWKIEQKLPTAPGELSIWPILTDIYFYRNILNGTKLKIKAPIDRFEEDKAVFILREDENAVIDEEETTNV